MQGNCAPLHSQGYTRSHEQILKREGMKGFNVIPNGIDKTYETLFLKLVEFPGYLQPSKAVGEVPEAIPQAAISLISNGIICMYYYIKESY